jgi:uncharacterized protein YndB with AHSA1/START domain
MNTAPVIKEVLIAAPAERVWKAISDRDEMKSWYFELEEFKSETGFEFSFYGGTEDRQYKHLCRVTEVVPGQRLSYSWKYEGYAGESLVTFELFPGGSKTKVKLTHAGLKTFPADNPDFRKENFIAGWDDIIGNSLKNYLEKAAA